METWISDTEKSTNRHGWIVTLKEQFVVVAQQADKIVGFATLDNGNYIDFLSVHKNTIDKG